jgi:hypothetical protein
VLISGQITKVRKERVTAVEHTQFHFFERNNIGHQLGPCFFPLWATGNKVVFNNPLAERFTRHTSRIAHTGELFNFIQRIWRYRRDNTVNHGRRESHMILDPVCQLSVHCARVSGNHITHDMTIFRHVVAGHHGKCGQTSSFAACKRFNDDARRRFRLMRILQVGGYHRTFQHQLPGCWRVAISFLGNGEGDNSHLRFAQSGKNGLKTINLRMQRVFNYANYSRCPGTCRHFRDGIQIILLFQIGNLLLTTNQVNFIITPVTAVLSGQDISVNTLMRAVKRTKSQMNNTRYQFGTIVVRNCSPGC